MKSNPKRSRTHPFSRIGSKVSLLFLGFFPPAGADAQTGPVQTGSRLAKIQRDLASYLPTHAGSLQQFRLIEYIESFAEPLGFQTERREHGQQRNFHSFSSNLEISVPARRHTNLATEDPLQSTAAEILFLTSLQTDQAEDLSLSLSLLEVLSQAPPQKPVRFVFLGAEYPEPLTDLADPERTANRMSVGSKIFFSHYTKKPLAVIYLHRPPDLQKSFFGRFPGILDSFFTESAEPPDSKIQIRYTGSRRQSPAKIPIALWEAFLPERSAVTLDLGYNLGASLGLFQQNSSPLDWLLEESLPAVLLFQTGAESGIVRGLQRFINLFDPTLPLYPESPGSDRYYWLWNLGSQPFFLSETLLLIFVFAVLCLTSLALVLYNPPLRRVLYREPLNMLFTFSVFPLLLASLFFAGDLTSLLLSAGNINFEQDLLLLLLAFTFKISTAMFLIYNSIAYFKISNLIHKSTMKALLFYHCSIPVSLAALLEPRFAPISLYTMLCSFCFTLAPFRFLKLLASLFFLLPLLPLLVLPVLIPIDPVDLVRSFLRDQGGLFWVAFLFLNGIVFFEITLAKAKKKYKYFRISTYSLFFFAAAVSALLLLFPRILPGRELLQLPAELQIEETFDTDTRTRTLQTSGRSLSGPVSLRFPYREHATVRPGSPPQARSSPLQKAELETVRKLYSLIFSISYKTPPAQQIFQVGLQAERFILHLILTLRGAQPLPLVLPNYPFTKNWSSPDGTAERSISLGPHPSRGLDIEILIDHAENPEMDILLEILLDINEPLAGIDLDPADQQILSLIRDIMIKPDPPLRNLDVKHYLRFRYKFPLGSPEPFQARDLSRDGD